MNTLILQKILEVSLKLIRNEEFRRRHVFNPETHFVRNRKLGFPSVMKYVLGNSRESMAFTSEKFAMSSGLESISPAAICKARSKISYEAFEELFEECARVIPVRYRLYGYRLIAFDGTKGELPNLPSLKEKYPVNSKQGYPMFHAMAARDILNNIFLCADFQPAPADERQMASQMLDKLPSEGAVIYLMDRGFPCIAIIQKINKKGQKFVMRVPKGFLKEVSKFTEGSGEDEEISISYDRKRGTRAKAKADLPYTFTLRCVRIHLDNGEEEILITNLTAQEFTTAQIQELYNLRWGIETSYDYLKNSLFVEEFTSKKENGIKQDFYASLWAANLTNAAIADSVEEPVKKGCLIG